MSAAQLEVEQGFFSELEMPNMPPPGREDAYVHRKGYYAIKLQEVCDHRKILTDIVVQWRDSTHDVYI